MRTYDYSFLNGMVPAKIVGTSEIIADLRAKSEIRRSLYAETFDALREKAIITSVKSSNAIEGIITTDDRMQELILGAKPASHDEAEISGYKDALNMIHTSYSDLNMDADLIKEFHRMIMQDAEPSAAGNYKTTDNMILEIDNEGHRRVRFRPVPAEETAKAMEQMILAYQEASQDAEIPKVLLIGCAVLDFLCIHPFRDGNGRISRLMTLLLLYQNGYDVGRYISIEKQIEEYKDAYYQALERSSKGWHEHENDYMPFAIFLMQILYRCYRELDDCFIDMSLKKASKKERVEAVLMNSYVPVSKRDLCDRLPDVSKTTIEAELARLLTEDKIVKIGSYRDARYKIKENE